MIWDEDENFKKIAAEIQIHDKAIKSLLRRLEEECPPGEERIWTVCPNFGTIRAIALFEPEMSY